MAFRSMLITGGAGFIGSNFVRLMATEQPDAKITVLDALTYAGNMENISDLTRENLSSVEQLSRAAQSLSQQAVDLSNMVAAFRVV